MKQEWVSAVVLMIMIVIAKYVFNFSDATIAILAFGIMASVQFSEIRELKRKIEVMERQLTFLVEQKLR